MGKVIGISTRVKKHAPMDELDNAQLTFKKGVAEDSRGKFQNHRQVTVISQESWSDACTDLRKSVPWTTRRANLLISGINLENTKGKHLKVGEIVLEITGELVPCHRMDEQVMGLTKTLETNWRGGVTCRMVSEGNLKKGDEIKLIDLV